MACRCTRPAASSRKGLGVRRLRRLRRSAANAPGKRRGWDGSPLPQGLKPLPPALPRRVYLVSQGCQGASCWRLKHDARSQPCSHGVARFFRNCASCKVAALDAEWAWHRPTPAGVALLQLAFWPSCEVFCLRLRTAEAGGPSVQAGRLPPSVRRLFGRGARGEALVVGFAVRNDLRRLWHAGLRRPGRVLDLQPWCTPPARRRLGLRISLADAAETFLGEGLDKGERLSDWEAPLSHAQLRYAAMDAWTTLRLLPAAPRRMEPAGADLSEAKPHPR